MPESSRIDELRRRVEKDPASIAFAQLAEECRRVGAFDEAVAVARAGLDVHPAYLSARVTLGRALVELNQLDEAEAELTLVLKSAPENLAAIRGLAETYHRRGDLERALAQYRAALALARNDPDLAQTVADLAREIEAPEVKAGWSGLTLRQVAQELSNLQSAGSVASAETSTPEPAAPTLEPAAPSSDSPPENPSSADNEGRRATHTVAALEEFLAALHVARAERRP
jgi:tetratricopeptide (TPR) repeat protein